MLSIAAVFLILPAAGWAQANDDYDQATHLEAGGTLLFQDNSAATAFDLDEHTVCDTPSGEVDYGGTLWYHVTVREKGTLTIETDGDFDTVIALYPPGGPGVAPLQCNDDSDSGGVGSKIVRDVAGGEYFLQVGGIGAEPDNDFGSFDITTTFVDHDSDNDGSSRPADCNDSNPNIKPGATDTPNDGVDSNCSGSDDVDDDGYTKPGDCVDTDRAIHPGVADIPHDGIDQDCAGGDNLDGDGDGIPTPQDCDDNNHNIHPGVAETPGDFVDEDCVGGPAAAQLSPFPTVVAPSLAYDKRTVFKGMTIKDVRAGYVITVRCRGRGCPRRSQKLTAKGSKAVKVRSFRRRALKPGAVVEVLVTLPGENRIGKYVKYQIRSGRTPAKRTDACLEPTTNKVRKCSP